MKNFVIKLVKNNPVLYRSAKKVYRTFQPAKPTLYRNDVCRVVYQISDPGEIPAILAHYNSYRRENTVLVILVKGNTLQMNTLIRQYSGIIFYSLDYYKKYQKRLYIKNMILTDCNQSVGDIIELL